MHCTSCAMAIDSSLEDTPGVFSANTSYARSQVKIAYDPSQVSVEKLIHVVGQTGYIAEVSA